MKKDKSERDLLLRVADALCAWLTARAETMAQAAEALVPLAWHSEIAHREEENGEIRTWDVSQFYFSYRKGSRIGVLLSGCLHRSSETLYGRETSLISGEPCDGMDSIVLRAALWLRHPRFAEDVEAACRRAVTAPKHHASLILRDREGNTFVIETRLQLNGNAWFRMMVMPDWSEYWCAEAKGAAWGAEHRWEKQRLSRSTVPGGYEMIYRGAEHNGRKHPCR